MYSIPSFIANNMKLYIYTFVGIYTRRVYLSMLIDDCAYVNIY